MPSTLRSQIKIFFHVFFHVNKMGSPLPCSQLVTVTDGRSDKQIDAVCSSESRPLRPRFPQSQREEVDRGVHTV